MAETVGTRIQRIAKDQGKPSGKHLANDLGVTFESLRLWTAGTTAPSRKRAQAIADYLGVSVEVVMFGAEAAPRQIDAEAIADAFNALPTSTPQDLDRRAWLYDSIIGMIASQRATAASAPAPQPAEKPTAEHHQRSETRP